MGWFSFEGFNATAGDFLAGEVVLAWLYERGFPADFAVAPSLGSGLDWHNTLPNEYSHLVFVCGPFGPSDICREIISRFQHCVKIGIDISIFSWNPFDVLIERDGLGDNRPDLSLAHCRTKIPLVGLLLVHSQREYSDRSRHDWVNSVLKSTLREMPVAVISIDTRYGGSDYEQGSAAEVESVIAHTDAIVSTRMHGLVLALKNGVPALAVDPVLGGAKVTAQAHALNWDNIIGCEELTSSAIRDGIERCLASSSKAAVESATGDGLHQISLIKQAFLCHFS